jgi:hypothetical protein
MVLALLEGYLVCRTTILITNRIEMATDIRLVGNEPKQPPENESKIAAWEDWKGWKRERARPRSAVRRAIESGKLIRPDKCSLDEPLDDYHSGRIEAHHNRGFDKEHWLDVIFLCHRCHNALTVGRAKLPTEV